MKYSREWVQLQLKSLYPNRNFTDNQIFLLWQALNTVALSSQHINEFHECKQEIPDHPEILTALRKQGN